MPKLLRDSHKTSFVQFEKFKTVVDHGMLSGTACKVCSKSGEQSGKEKKRKRTERERNTARRGQSKTRVFGPARATVRASSRRDDLSRHTAAGQKFLQFCPKVFFLKVVWASGNKSSDDVLKAKNL